jgi:hypothetical protein
MMLLRGGKGGLGEWGWTDCRCFKETAAVEKVQRAEAHALLITPAAAADL